MKWPALVAVLVLPSCGTMGIHHAVFQPLATANPAHHGDVTVSFSREPQRATEIAVVQAYGGWSVSIDRLIPELTRAAARLGADLVKVDRITVRYDQVEESRTVDYACGTAEEPRTCTTIETETKEVPTAQALGRAFRTRPE